MTLELNQTLFRLVKDGNMDKLVTEATKLDGLLDKSAFPFAESDVPIHFVLDFLPSIYLPFSHF